MGGPGSGNHWRRSARPTTDDFPALDVRDLARVGLMHAGCGGRSRWTRHGEEIASIRTQAEEGRLVLAYRQRRAGGTWKDQAYSIPIERTGCHFGGTRAWFLCPVRGCGRRVAILYCDGVFACRHCVGLAYASSREDSGDRACRRADRLREGLGWEPGILNGSETWNKPKWMRWRTFGRKVARHDRLVALSIGQQLAKLRRYA